MVGRQQQGRRRRWITGGLVAVALGAALAAAVWPAAAAAKPGAVTNRQGETFRGDVTEDEKFVYVNTPGGQLRLDRRNIATIDYAADVDAQYTKRHAKLAANDVKGRVDLAHWANEHGRPDLALTALEEARAIDPANRDVALTMDAVQHQMDLDRRQGKPATAPPAAAQPGKPTAGASPATAPTTGPSTPSAPQAEHRLLTMAEVNAIRLHEMRDGDRLVKVRMENNVVRRYLMAENGSATGKDVAMFNRGTPEQQALEIATRGTPDMARDVHILTDPTPMHIFKVKVMPLIAQTCGSPACHGGPHAGDFALYPGEGTQALYTNFYILTTYAAQIGEVRYLPLDREVPERSLVLNFGLPPLQGHPPHPAVRDWRARFHSPTDPAYSVIADWLTDDLSVIQHDYGFNVSPRLTSGGMAATMPAATEPATAPAATPPARAQVHGTPLPRVNGGATTLPSR